MRMKRLLLAGGLLLVGSLSAGVTQADLLKAEPEIRKVTEDLLDDLVDGRISRIEAADAARIMASQTDDEAEAYLLLQGAFRLLVRAGDYAQAAEILRHMRTREYSVAALVALARQALEPVSRGVNVGDLEVVITDLAAEAVRLRTQRAERRVESVLANPLQGFSLTRRSTVVEGLDGLRKHLPGAATNRVQFIVRCPLFGTWSEELPVWMGDVERVRTGGSFLEALCADTEFTIRTHGGIRLLTRTLPVVAGGVWKGSASETETQETTRLLKRIRIGFAAFDENERLDEAIERLVLTLADQDVDSCLDFDLLLRSPPDGRFQLIRTVRAADSTLYDTLSYLCTAAHCSLAIRGRWVVVLPTTETLKH